MRYCRTFRRGPLNIGVISYIFSSTSLPPGRAAECSGRPFWKAIRPSVRYAPTGKNRRSRTCRVRTQDQKYFTLTLNARLEISTERVPSPTWPPSATPLPSYKVARRGVGTHGHSARGSRPEPLGQHVFIHARREREAADGGVLLMNIFCIYFTFVCGDSIQSPCSSDCF